MTTTVLAYIPSPSQGVWHLFGVIPLRAYALCIIAGIVAALIIGDRRWVARGGEQGVIYDIALWAVPFGLIGGRLYHVMTDWPKYFGSDGAGFLAALRIWDGGLGIWGAVALGGVGAWIACRRRNIPLPAFGDAIAPGIILAQAIGRLGNYFNQELYGRETDLPWGLTIWERLDPSGVISPHSLDGVSTGQVYAVVHPTFLYELIWNVLIFALLIWVDRRFTIGHGRLFALYVAGYCVGRFWVELMRSDTATLIAGIRINTFTSMFVFIAAVVYIMVAPKGREDPATLGGNESDGGRGSALDTVGHELAAVTATSGVVAAAKVAGDGDTSVSEPNAESEPAEPASAGTEADDGREASLGSVEGDAAAEAEDNATEVHESAAAAAAEADAVAEQVADQPASATAAEPAVALEGTEVAEALNAEVEPEDGLGSVDGDEVAEAQDDAAEVHEAAVDNAEAADTAAEDLTEPATDADESPEETTTDGPDTDDDAAGADMAADDADVADQPTDGLGSVEPDEVAAAEDDAAEVHEAAVDNAEAADTAAEDLTEPATDADESPEETATDGPDTDDTAADDADVADQPTDGLGSVEPDEVAAAEDDAAEVHEAAIDDAEAADAVADEIASEPVAPAAAPTEQPRRRWWRRG